MHDHGSNPVTHLIQALRNSRIAIGIMAMTYGLSVIIGIVMVHAGNGFALRFRDSLVAYAHRTDPAARANMAGHHVAAAAIDFSRNLFLVAVPDTIGGLTLVLPVGLGTYRGWVGGIVSVDGKHRSRLTAGRSALYYLVTLAVQLAGFILAGGAGLHLGWAFLCKQEPTIGPTWFRVPKRALFDACWLYLLIVPILALGSLWEFGWPQT